MVKLLFSSLRPALSPLQQAIVQHLLQAHRRPQGVTPAHPIQKTPQPLNIAHAAQPKAMPQRIQKLRHRPKRLLTGTKAMVPMLPPNRRKRKER